MNIPTLNGPMVPPASGGAPTSMVILLHGYGSNGDDLIGLVPYRRQALPGTLFLSPNAPQPCPGVPGGRQWWPLASLSPEARAAGVRSAEPVLGAFIDAQLTQHGLSEDRLALVGFSQGTMMALHAGPRRPRALAGIVGYSGMLADPDGLGAEPHTKPPILLIHGDADPVVPVAALRHAERALGALGFEVDAHVSPGLPHSIDQLGLDLGQTFLTRCWAEMSETLPAGARSAPSTARNREPILAVLQRVLPPDARVLEIASGAGEHALFFAEAMPGLRWRPTDPSEEARTSIAAWRDAAGLANLAPPLVIDAADPASWPEEPTDAVVCINMIHISPWAATEGLMAGAGARLPAGGVLVLYGPYIEADVETAPSNLAFDESLRSRDPAWGLRRLDEVAALAARHGLDLGERVAMPANNLMLVFVKRAST